MPIRILNPGKAKINWKGPNVNLQQSLLAATGTLAYNMARNKYHAYRGAVGMKGRYKKKSKVVSRNVRSRAITRTQNMGWHNLNRNMLTPSFRILTFRYTQAGSNSSSATPFTTGAQESFALNGLFDPQLVGGGHQPYGFDQILPFYARYKVYAVSLTLTWQSDETTEIMLGCSSLLMSSDGFNMGTQSSFLIEEKPGGDVRRIPPNGEMTYKVSKYVTIKDIEGCGTELSDDDYSSVFLANPTRISKLNFAVASATASSAKPLFWNLNIEYHTRVYQRKVMPSSTA